jgi:hypothetical protein
VPYLSATAKTITNFIRNTFIVLAVLVLLTRVIGLSIVPDVLGGKTVQSYIPLLFMASMLGMVLRNSLSASGAFELVNVDTQEVLYSKLQSGKLPKTADQLLAAIRK